MITEARGEREKKREIDGVEDTTLPALEMEEESVSRRMPATSRTWERQGNRISLRASRRNTVLLTFDLSLKSDELSVHILSEQSIGTYILTKD